MTSNETGFDMSRVELLAGDRLARLGDPSTDWQERDALLTPREFERYFANAWGQTAKVSTVYGTDHFGRVRRFELKNAVGLIVEPVYSPHSLETWRSVTDPQRFLSCEIADVRQWEPSFVEGGV